MDKDLVKYAMFALVGYAVVKYVLPSLTGPRAATTAPPALGYGNAQVPYQPGQQPQSPYAPPSSPQGGNSTDSSLAIANTVIGAVGTLGNLALGAYNSGVFGGSGGGGDTSGGYDDSPGGYVDNSM